MTDDADRARIAALEALVGELHAELARVRTMQRRSMRETYRCSSCGGTTILHFRHVQDMAHNGMVDLALQKEYSAWFGMKHSAGALEAFACRGCRLVEWHAISLDGVVADGRTVVELDGAQDARASDDVPYR